MIASISDDRVVWDTILKPLYAMGAGWVKKCARRAKNNRARRERSCHPEGDALLRPEGASRAKGAEGPHPEDAGGFPDSPEVPFFAVTPQLSLRGHTFFCLARKKYAKKSRWTRSIALTRGKTSRYILPVVVTLQVKERPSGDRRIGFPHRTINKTSRNVRAR